MYLSVGLHEIANRQANVRSIKQILTKDFIAMVLGQSICTKVAVFQIKIPIFAGYINYLVD